MAKYIPVQPVPTRVPAVSVLAEYTGDKFALMRAERLGRRIRCSCVMSATVCDRCYAEICAEIDKNPRIRR